MLNNTLNNLMNIDGYIYFCLYINKFYLPKENYHLNDNNSNI